MAVTESSEKDSPADNPSLKIHTKLLNIFSNPKFHIHLVNKHDERKHQCLCISLTSSLSARNLRTVEYIQENHKNDSALQTLVSKVNILTRTGVSRFSLSWLWKVYAAENDGVSERMKHTATSEKKEEKNHCEKVIVKDEDIKNYLSKETGIDRLHDMFYGNEIGEKSPEMTFINQVVFQSAAVTFLIMSTLGGRSAREELLMRNKATVFKTKFQAFRKIHDAVFLESMKQGVKWGFKITVFTLPFLLVSQSIAVYRNKTSPFEYTVAAAVTGSILKFGLGPRGMFAGGLISGAMGAVCGLMVWGALKLTHQTQEERHYEQIRQRIENNMTYKRQAVISSGDQMIPNPSA